MKVLFDHQIFQLQEFGGISRYFTSLIRSLRDEHGIDCVTSVKYSKNVHLATLMGDQIEPPGNRESELGRFMGGAKFKGKKRLFDRWIRVKPPLYARYEALNKENSIKLLRAGDYDLFHPTYYDEYFMEHLDGKPFVLTVYDLIHEIFPEFAVYWEPNKTRRLL
ncbi:MAG TPA: hypothetical protein VGO93_17480, partial [Candidatus Xenobia bacterium]